MDKAIWECFQTGESDAIFVTIAYGGDVNFQRPCDRISSHCSHFIFDRDHSPHGSVLPAPLR